MFKDKLKRLRLAADLTQEELANKLFVSRSAIAKWEQGRGTPKKEMLADIAKVFKVRIETFEEDENEINITDYLKKQKKIRHYLRIIPMILSLIAILIFVVILNRKNDTNSYNLFFSEQFLNKFELSGLHPAKVDQSGSLILNAQYYSTLDNEIQFEEYADYVLNFLCGKFPSGHIGYLKESPQQNAEENYYIAHSDKTDNYRDEQNNYSFFYSLNLSKNRLSKESVNFFVIRLFYSKTKQSFLRNDGTIYEYNFSMTIADAKNKPDDKYFIFEEFF